MAKIIPLYETTTDTIKDNDELASLRENHAQLKKSNPKDKLTKIVGNAVKVKERHVKDHLARLKDYTGRVANKKIIGWVINYVGIAEGKNVVDRFQWAEVSPTLFTKYDDAKFVINKVLKQSFRNYKHEELTSGDCRYTGDPDDLTPFYMVNDYTDLGHDWNVPIARFRLKKGEDYIEAYIKPIEQAI